jgi:hypothetical protein
MKKHKFDEEDIGMIWFIAVASIITIFTILGIIVFN